MGADARAPECHGRGDCTLVPVRNGVGRRDGVGAGGSGSARCTSAGHHWNVEWRGKLNPSPNGCSGSGYTTETKIVTTLPRWTPPADVSPEVKVQWTRFFVALAQHEAGHARIGRAAAVKVDETIRQVGVQPDCDTVQRLINERAESVLAEHRRQDEEYDRRTDHGRKPAGTP